MIAQFGHGGTRSPDGRQSRDTFTSLKKTYRKLGASLASLNEIPRQPPPDTLDRHATSTRMQLNGKLVGLAVLLCFLGGLRLFWLGDIPFINDEPLLFLRALQQNADGIFTTHGLLGSRGVDYGPFPLWFYRTVLFFTHNIILIAAIKTSFITLITGLSVYWIASLCSSLNPLYGAIAFMSPYLWFYARDLWDNSFVIPLSALTIASYLRFCRSGKNQDLLLVTIAASAGFLTHLVFLPVLFSLGLHFLFFKRSYVVKKPLNLLMAILIGLVLISPYLLHLIAQHPTQKLEPGDIGHILMPFTGPRFFSSLGLEYFLGSFWCQPTSLFFVNSLWVGGIGISGLAYLLFIIGGGMMGGYIFKKQNPDSDLFSLMIFIFLGQVFLSWAYRLIPIPNFHSAVWLVYFIFIWYALTKISQNVKIKKIIPLYLMSLGMGTFGFALFVHYHHGSRALHHGPTLQNLITLQTKLNFFNPVSPRKTEVIHLKEFPWALEALHQLTPSVPHTNAPTEIQLSYRFPEDPKHGEIILGSP